MPAEKSTGDTFKEFTAEVKALLEGNAGDKGYNTNGADGDNELYEFVQGISGSDAHALGEIVYKAVRFSKKRERKDLAKIAAWAFLVWKFGK